MRPGCGLMFREGWFHTRHTPPPAPTSGGKDPTTENPKASSTCANGEGGALARVRFANSAPKEGRKEERGRERERERENKIQQYNLGIPSN